ncbi:MAG: hypothetical protein ACFE8A_04175 [Candidatus Hodarchaeota archaeon]
MKVSKILVYGMLMVSLLMPYIAVGYAADKPRYLGVSEGQEVIWKTEFDKGPLEDYFEDIGLSELVAEQNADTFFSWYDWDDDVEAWKIYVEDIRDEKESDWDDITNRLDDEDDVKHVKILVNMYETEDLSDAEAWDDFDKLESYTIYEAEEIVYAEIALHGLQDILGIGLYQFVVPKNLKWNKIVNEIDDWLDDNNLEDTRAVDDVEVNYFFQDKGVGIKTNRESTTAGVEDFDSETRYTDDGILYYYEYEYDGDTIAKFELSILGQSLVYTLENWWWITLIVVAAIIGVIILIIVIKKKRK